MTTVVERLDVSLGTTAEHALEHLRALILTRELVPGRRIGQEELAAGLGVSLAPVREALRILEQEGLVTYRPHRGYFVTELSLEDLEEIYELRRILEDGALRRALPSLDDQALVEIASAAADCSQAADTGNVAAELAANRRFHFRLVESAGQPHTTRLIRRLWDATEAYLALYYNSTYERSTERAAHERILAAVRDRDAERAVAELDGHRRRTLDVLRELLGTEPG